MISNSQEKALRIINKTPLPLNDLALKLKVSTGKLDEILCDKETDLYIAKFSDNPFSITTSEAGKAILQHITKDKWRFRIPVAISVIALIGAYRHELYLLIQVLL